uniref:Uncharacterized protein n=1 Tax=Pithovirus LCPAC406 TaxID=2506599 RepID=A0A481ZFT0_9VIRU|nr:MAG: uncharacterized protein LCPAC406_00030 [Pithovirus LCPAC406]
MSSVDEILARLRLKVEDLNTLNPSLVQGIFLDLSVGEISKLCAINKKFNDECLRESLWQIKVWADYGVDKKYGETWKETAKNMFIVGMINLNERWINGETYNEILKKASSKGKDGKKYLFDIQVDALLNIQVRYYLYNSSREVVGFFAFRPFSSLESELETILEEGTDNKEEYIRTEEYFMDTLTKEFAIIASVITLLSKEYPLLPVGPKRIRGLGPHRNPSSILTAVISKLIDPIPYIMQACAYVTDDQDQIVYTQYRP